MNGNTATVREILERPFDPSLIKSRPGSFGNSLNYVEGHEYVKRLNEAFNGDWSFEIAKHEVDENEVIVVGKLVADGIVKMAFGGSEIKRKKDTGEIICLADDLKAAATDALKKASSFLGVGLHLYGDQVENSAPKNSGNGNAHAGNENGNGNGSGPRLSSRQLGMILGLARDRNINRDQLQEMIYERYGRKLEFLSKSEASFFIGELQAA